MSPLPLNTPGPRTRADARDEGRDAPTGRRLRDVRAALVWMRLFVLLIAMIVPTVASAQAPVAAEGLVTRVTVEGTRRIDEAVVLAAIGLRRGERLTPEKVRRDLKAVHGTGFFRDVRFELVPEGEGYALVVIVEEKPAVREVLVEGSRRIKEEDVREVLDIRSFSVLNQAAVNTSIQAVRDLYMEKGFYLAEVQARIEPVADDQVDVVFDIVEGRKVLVQSIEFTGNDNLPDSRIKRFLQIKEGGFLPWLSSAGTFRRDLLEADAQTVSAVYLEEGYVDVQVQPPNVYLSPDKRYIFITYHVDEGQQYDIGAVDAMGDFDESEGLTKQAVMEIIAGRPVHQIQEEQWREVEERRRLINLNVDFEGRGPSLDEGDVFKFSEVHRVMAAIESLYQDQGYAFVNVVPLTDPDPERQVVNVTFAIERGEKVRIGRIHITGNDPTFDKIVRREILINEGDIYRGSLIQASRMRLQRLGFFNEVNVSTPRGDGPDVLDLNLQVSEQPTGSFSLGMGYSNLESFVLTANVSKNNFLGLGYNMAAAINWSGLRQQGNLSFFDPHFLDSRWNLSISLYSISRSFQLDEFQRGGSLGVGRYLDARNDVELRFTYTMEDVGLNNIDPYRRRMLGGELYRNGLTSSIGINFQVDKRNNRIFPTQGWLASASSSLAGGFRLDDDRLLSLFGGDFNFMEHRFNVRFYQPIVPNSDLLVFRVNSTVGILHSTDGTILPFIHRYRAGGINSVRGYNWFSLGPFERAPATEDPTRADDKIIVGGSKTWVNNFELEMPLIRQAGIKAVVFFDAGNAFGDPWEQGPFNPLALRSAYGAGLRWQSPIGPLRFEYGIPINPREDERRSVFDFSIGSFF